MTPSQNLTEAGTTRKRAQRACKECHSHKTKCSGEKPRCKRCAANDLVCIYQVSKRKFSSAPGSQQQTPGAQQSPPGDVESQSPSIAVSREAKQLVSPSASLASPGLTETNPQPTLGTGLVVEYVLYLTAPTVLSPDVRPPNLLITQRYSRPERPAEEALQALVQYMGPLAFYERLASGDDRSRD